MRHARTIVVGVVIAALTYSATPLSAAEETGRTQAVPESVSGWPVWKEIVLERGDTGPWNECAKIARGLPPLITERAFSIEACVTASATLSGVAETQFDALPVGTRLWVPAGNVALSEVWRRVTAAELRGEPFLLLEDVPAAREALGIAELAETVDSLTGEVADLQANLSATGDTLENHASAIETLDARMGQTSADVTALGEELSGVQAAIDQLDGSLASVRDEVRVTGIGSWFNDWWWVPVLLLLLLLALVALAVIGWQSRRTSRDVATERTRIDTVKGRSDKAIDMAKLATTAHFSGYELKGDPVTQAQLKEKLQSNGDVLVCELVNVEDPSVRHVVTFTRVDNAFGDGRPGLRVDGVEGQRRPIAFRASAVLERLALATRTGGLRTSAA